MPRQSPPTAAVPDALLTWQQVGIKLNRGRWWVLTHADEIGAVRLNGRLLGFRPADVDAWINRHRVISEVVPVATVVAPVKAPTPITALRRPTAEEVAAFDGRGARGKGR